MKDNEKFKLSDENLDGPVDLTYSISPSSDVWPGDRRPEFDRTRTISRDGVNVSRFSMNVHSETHIDAPNHFVEGRETIDELPLEKFYGKAVLYQSTDGPKGQKIGLEEVRGSGIEINKGDIFILHSGLQALRGDDRYYEEFPTPTTTLLNWLIDKGIKLYGTDCPSIDPLNSESHENHNLLLPRGIPIVENLANLDSLEGKEDIIFFSFPLRLKALEASPCRAVAITGSDA